ncbi:thioesterase domain-containing protein [Streptomyces sp. ISL-94]|uniref:thioesterase II family protein n=1 Tax=Streptomyces sp. ISL-94 TaxID=2819190 RepID=UPI001BE729BC|nr:thioesterase domain-containing protein [Streptomyces sp. ISL-94]MBT2479335.1 thioesterase [Streptomyces sp. ISL-94]
MPDDTYLMRTYCVTEPGKYRLACFPHILDPPRYYLGLSGLLLPTVEVLPFQYLESCGDGAPTRIRDVEDLADQALVSLMEWTDLPLALFGHRSGAYLAYRVAQRMERAGGPVPATLFVAGRRAPSREDRRERGRLSCRIVALAGDSTEEPARADVEEWSECTSGSFDLELFPGVHGLLESNQRQVANLIHDELLSAASPPIRDPVEYVPRGRIR